MKLFKRLSKIFILLAMLSFLASSCASSVTCNDGGWYSKNKNLGPKNKPIKR